jgi:hypothetical protein
MQTLDDAWRYEVVRLTEIRSGPLEDAHVNSGILQMTREPTDWLINRAKALAPMVQADAGISSVKQTARLLIISVWLVAFFVGAAAGVAALGDPTRPINILWVLLALLLLPTVSLFVWLISLGLKAASGGWLGQGLEWLLGKAAQRGPQARAWQAFLALAQSSGSLRWWVGLATHTIWVATLTGVVLAMVLAFSLRHYTFVWETTWLADELFVGVAQGIGTIPSWLGFTGPDAQMISASGNTPVDDSLVRARWANWLLGAVVTFGLLPRLLACAVSAIALRRCFSRAAWITEDAYAISLLNRLGRMSERAAVDGPPGLADQLPQAQFLDPQRGLGLSAVLPLECHNVDAFLSPVPEQTVLLPVLDDRASRHEAITRLSALRANRLLVVCDSGQTPDRGTLNVLLSLSPTVVHLRVLLTPVREGRDRRAIWRDKILAIGLAAPYESAQEARRWLAGEVDG